MFELKNSDGQKVPYYKTRKFWGAVLALVAAFVAGSMTYSDALTQAAHLFFNN